ncbi:hypothetical protein RHSIM_Rhsim08G0192200 [Rhododendron simsii]|uniref:Uncharacterized protein n=1 Tax=Rhododendron simsii TaxID=118357 RepID=A0A834GI92_RHOSS|nr:hypothetical protein RHSIM_Rhsim08G0192200 [Rhododendron simsii]
MQKACLVSVHGKEREATSRSGLQARRLGSPDVNVESGDVSKVEDYRSGWCFPVESTEGCTKAIFKISHLQGRQVLDRASLIGGGRYISGKYGSWPTAEGMDSIHKLLNIVLPLISLFSLFIFLPAILLFKISGSILRSVFSENVSGKVVLITGASSGIGEHLAYEYAKGGACLVLVARREKQLQEVACKARRLGSPDLIVESGDVSKVEDYKRFVDAALNHFGKCMYIYIYVYQTLALNINFWGFAYCTHFAIPHLRKSRGKITVVASMAQWCPVPRASIYCAKMDNFPVESTEGCTKAIFKSICRGDRYLIEPAWVRMIHLWNLLCPEAVESFIRWVLITRLNNNSNPTHNSGQLKAD